MTATLETSENPAHESAQATKPTVLMCRPEHFTVSYRINPWMHPEDPTDTSLALQQWSVLYATYVDLGFTVQLIDPLPGLPDMVYAANGGFVLDWIAYGARFHYPERQPEGPAYMEWFRSKGLDVREPQETNEGEGDFLLVGDTILAASGFRSDTSSHQEIADIYGREVVSLQLVNPSYYHLDTALAVLDSTTIAYLPSAFDEASLTILRQRYPDAIIATEEDAAILGLNSFSDGHNVVIAERATTFAKISETAGLIPLALSSPSCCSVEVASSVAL